MVCRKEVAIPAVDDQARLTRADNRLYHRLGLLERTANSKSRATWLRHDAVTYYALSTCAINLHVDAVPRKNRQGALLTTTTKVIE